MSEALKPDFAKDIEKKYGKDIGPGESTITNSNQYNQGTIQKQLVHEKLNTCENWQLIVDAIKSGRARDLADEPNANKAPCFVIGSGPSLDDSIEYLKDWKGGIFCTTSHALTLMYHGIEPTHIVVLDPFCIEEEIKGVDWSKTKTKLVAHPSVHPSILKCWPNEILLYLQNSGRADSFYASSQKIMYSHREGDLRSPTFHFYIRTEMLIFACSPPMQMFVADKLGYGTVFLAGCDFAFHKDKDRFTDYTVAKSGYYVTSGNSEDIYIGPTWEKHVHDYIPNEKHLITNNGLPTEEVHLYYKKNMISAWRLSLQTVYTTDHGSITEIPYTDIKKVIRKQGLEYPKQSKQLISKIAERYLASVNAYVIEAESGVLFVESLGNYKEELMGVMQRFKEKYKCPKCNVTVQANDHKDYLGTTCPNCKEGILEYMNKIDIEYNMNKFNKLYSMFHAEEIKKENEEAVKVDNETLKAELEKSGILKE